MPEGNTTTTISEEISYEYVADEISYTDMMSTAIIEQENCSHDLEQLKKIAEQVQADSHTLETLNSSIAALNARMEALTSCIDNLKNAISALENGHEKTTGTPIPKNDKTEAIINNDVIVAGREKMEVKVSEIRTLLSEFKESTTTVERKTEIIAEIRTKKAEITKIKSSLRRKAKALFKDAPDKMAEFNKECLSINNEHKELYKNILTEVKQFTKEHPAPAKEEEKKSEKKVEAPTTEKTKTEERIGEPIPIHEEKEKARAEEKAAAAKARAAEENAKHPHIERGKATSKLMSHYEMLDRLEQRKTTVRNDLTKIQADIAKTERLIASGNVKYDAEQRTNYEQKLAWLKEQEQAEAKRVKKQEAKIARQERREKRKLGIKPDNEDLITERKKIAEDIIANNERYHTANNPETQTLVSQLEEVDRKLLGHKAKRVHKEFSKPMFLNAGRTGYLGYTVVPKEYLERIVNQNTNSGPSK